MGFCPDLPLTKPFCKGSGLEWTAGPKGKGFNFLPARTLEEAGGLLVLETDETFVPDDRSRNGDHRRLGLRIHQFDLRPAGT